MKKSIRKTKQNGKELKLLLVKTGIRAGARARKRWGN